MHIALQVGEVALSKVMQTLSSPVGGLLASEFRCAGITAEAGEYRWSSHRAYMGSETILWLSSIWGLVEYRSSTLTALGVLLSRDVSTLSSAVRRLDEKVRKSDDLARIKRELSGKIVSFQA